VKFIITTSRKPPNKVRSFAKDIAFIFATKPLTRGKFSLKDLIKKLNNNDKLLIIDCIKGNPSRIRVIDKKGKASQILLKRIKLIREMKEKPKFKNNVPVVLNVNEFSEKFSKILDLKLVKSIEEAEPNCYVIKFVNEQNLFSLYLVDPENKKTFGKFFTIRKIIMK
jgi:U3 small nucleolar ribonucleoprotein protein IMP4